MFVYGAQETQTSILLSVSRITVSCRRNGDHQASHRIEIENTCKMVAEGVIPPVIRGGVARTSYQVSVVLEASFPGNGMQYIAGNSRSPCAASHCIGCLSPVPQIAITMNGSLSRRELSDSCSAFRVEFRARSWFTPQADPVLVMDPTRLTRPAAVSIHHG